VAPHRPRGVEPLLAWRSSDMEAFLDLPWRHGPAAGLVLAGIVLFARGLALWRSAGRIDRDPGRALAYARGFRIGILGLCSFAFGLGWSFGLGWVVVVSLIVLGEEMLETSVMIAALRATPARGA